MKHRIMDHNAEEPDTPSKRGDDMQWPALEKLTPGNLKRTVSTLMHEWEKSLTPPPGGCQDPSVKPERHEKTDQERSISQMPLL